MSPIPKTVAATSLTRRSRQGSPMRSGGGAGSRHGTGRLSDPDQRLLASHSLDAGHAADGMSQLSSLLGLRLALGRPSSSHA
jgi:hypothetical protein